MRAVLHEGQSCFMPSSVPLRYLFILAKVLLLLVIRLSNIKEERGSEGDNEVRGAYLISEGRGGRLAPSAVIEANYSLCLYRSIS